MLVVVCCALLLKLLQIIKTTRQETRKHEPFLAANLSFNAGPQKLEIKALKEVIFT